MSILYTVTLLATMGLGGNILGGSLFNLLAPNSYVVRAFGASGAVPVFIDGMWWTVLSAGWLHGGALHILFNMMWVRQLGPVTADIYGAGRMVIIYTIAGVVGFLVSSTAGLYLANAPLPFLRGAGLTFGASAPIFGLLGALVHYGRRGGSSLVGGQAMQLRRRAVRVRLDHAGRHRQLRPRRRIRRRLRRAHVARSAQARADGSLHRRGRSASC